MEEKKNSVQEMSLSEAKNWLRHRLEKGARCPLCTQYAKVYTRKLNSGMAYSLIWLVLEYQKAGSGGRWVEVQKQGPRSVLASREMGKLVHWGLAEKKENEEDKTKKNTGLWRPTPRGVDFVMEKIQVPTCVRLYDNRRLGFSSEKTTIRKALGDKFNYEELMRG